MPRAREHRFADDGARQAELEPSIDRLLGLSNEITINGVTDDLLENHRILNELCHTLDASRLTTMACVSMLETDSPLLHVSDILSYNHYFGWYARA
jgi:hypothetical protein